MKLLWVILISFLILFLHEMGHLTAAKIMKLSVRKFSFSMLPFPRFFVSIIDHGITLRQRIIYFLSGNMVTIFLFVACYCVTSFNIQMELLTYILAVQILVETNPFLSDYSSLLFYLKNRKQIDSIPTFVYNKVQEKEIESNLSNLRESYFLCSLWCIHFFIWTILIITLLSIVPRPF